MSTATSYGFDENTSEVGGSKFIDVTPETAIAEGKTTAIITEVMINVHLYNSFFPSRKIKYCK